jgi:hypothetical protein
LSQLSIDAFKRISAESRCKLRLVLDLSVLQFLLIGMTGLLERQGRGAIVFLVAGNRFLELSHESIDRACGVPQFGSTCVRS